MNTHKLKYLLIGLLFPLAFSSCEDFLDKQPLDSPSKATFWKSEADATMGLAACYGRLNNDCTGATNGGGSLHHSGGITDEGYAQYPWEGGYTNVPRGIIESTTGGVLSNFWYNGYRGITTCNVFLENVETIPMAESVKSVMKGEALFLRAFWYNYLTALYGDVPLILKVLSVDESMKLTRTPKAEVVTQILKDLDDAAALLPDVIYAGHAVKGSALALKARVCLWNEKWAEAATAAKAVMDNPLFALHPDYLAMCNGNAENGNKEILFSVKYLAPDVVHGLDYEHGSWFSSTPIQDYVDFFEKLPGWDAANPYENRDPRLKLTVLVPGAPFPYVKPGDVFVPELNAGKTKYGLIKFIKVVNTSSSQCDQDIIHLRLADVMLMYAEAKLKSGQNDASALKALNDVRARFGDVLAPKTTLDMDAIMYERKAELGFEGLRFFDIRRWRIGPQAMIGLKDPVAVNYTFNEAKHYLWPIPQGEINIMGAGFGQNPGY
jgi:starch-binding outer membrane protein, SusD/RagB family